MIEHSLTEYSRLLIVLTSFKDVPIRPDAAHYFKRLFFSKEDFLQPGNSVKTSSVTTYYEQVSGGRVSITGDIFGPYMLPQTVGYYCQDGHGKDNKAGDPKNPNTQTMACHALDALLKDKPDIDLGRYDNQTRPGFVDGLIVVHAGEGGELHVAEPTKYIWSVQWVMKDQRFVGKSNTGVYNFLTLPEDARMGVCAHELGHLAFQWPDLYRTKPDRGVGRWCVMSGGAWNAIKGTQEGDVPCHPSAWLKIQQGWVEVRNVKGSVKNVLLNEIKGTTTTKGGGVMSSAPNPKGFNGVYRLWANGDENGKEFFLIENRMKYGAFDQSLGGDGLLIWHIWDGRNASNPKFFTADLLNADLEFSKNPVPYEFYDDGPGCPFPGEKNNRAFTATTTPNSKGYNREDTFVSITNISDAGPTMSMDISVQGAKARL